MTALYDPENWIYLEGDEIWWNQEMPWPEPSVSIGWEHVACHVGPDNNYCLYLKHSVAHPQSVPQPPQPPPLPQGFTDTYQPSVALQNYFNQIDGIKMKKTAKDPLNTKFFEAFGIKNVVEGDIGLEIEAEGKNLFNSPISFWNCHVDQSLRACEGHPALEYVLKQPLSRPKITEALNYLSKKLKSVGSEIKMSYRCSVHVHVNCQQMTMRQIYQFILLYMIFEELLVDFSGSERIGNFFCLRAKDAEYWVKILQDSIKTLNFTDLFSDNFRYTSCNTASLGKFGSLEFRSMRGTVDQKLIETWIDLLIHIRDVALDFDSPKDMAEFFMSAGPTKFYNAVFEDNPRMREALQGKHTTAERNKSLWDGFRLMRDVVYATDWNKKPEPKPKKEKIDWSLPISEQGGWNA